MSEIRFQLKTCSYWLGVTLIATSIIDALKLGSYASFVIGGFCVLVLNAADDYYRAIVKAGGR